MIDGKIFFQVFMESLWESTRDLIMGKESGLPARIILGDYREISFASSKQGAEAVCPFRRKHLYRKCPSKAQ